MRIPRRGDGISATSGALAFRQFVADSGSDPASADEVLRLVRTFDDAFIFGPGFVTLSAHNQLMVCAAMWWAHHGWKIFPTRGQIPAIRSLHTDANGRRVYLKCKRTGPNKCPEFGHGHHDATAELDQIWKWWCGPYRGCDISTACGERMFNIDLDPEEGGLESLARLEAEHGEQTPPTMTVLSGGEHDGYHLFFWRPEGSKIVTNIAPGLTGKTVSTLPPSVHHTTGRRLVLIDRPIAVPPDSLLRLAMQPPKLPRPKRTTPYTGPNTFAEFEKGRSFEDLLGSHGWDKVGEDGDEGSFWRHPSATHDVSAHVRRDSDDRLRLYVFSINTPFEATSPGDAHGYDLFDATVLLDFDGDEHALRKELNRNMFGRGGQ